MIGQASQHSLIADLFILDIFMETVVFQKKPAIFDSRVNHHFRPDRPEMGESDDNTPTARSVPVRFV